MNKILKVSLLIITLAIPLAIFIFLRLFGENKFDIPVYHQDGVVNGFEGCSYGPGQFTVPDSLLKEGRNNLFLFFSNSVSFNSHELNNQLNRLDELYGDDRPEITIYSQDSVMDTGFSVNYLSPEEIKKLMQCALVTDRYNQFILVDAQGRIRGYFDHDLDEMDRLVVEIKILLENGVGK